MVVGLVAMSKYPADLFQHPTTLAFSYRRDDAKANSFDRIESGNIANLNLLVKEARYGNGTAL